MKVVLFAGAALVGLAAVFGAVRASQEATPVVVAETKRVIRQVTQTELVEKLKADFDRLAGEYAEYKAYAEDLLSQRASALDAALAAKHNLELQVERLQLKLAHVEEEAVEAKSHLIDLGQRARHLFDEVRAELARD